MIFSLINVSKIHKDGTVSGNWLQDHIGTLESAIQKAINIEAVNSNKIDIAIVESNSGFQAFTCSYYKTRLDEKRIND